MAFDSISFYEPEGHLVPMRLVNVLLDSVAYGSTMRIVYQLLHYTGCRIAELDNMRWDQVRDGIIWWKLGKNQHEYRKERLPDELLREMTVYRATHRCLGERVLGIPASACRHRFVLARPGLGPEWNETVPVLRKGKFGKAYRYQLKGLRKNFQTILFHYYWRKYASAEVALELVSKRMKHSSRKVTAYHYIENIDLLRKEHFDFDSATPTDWIVSTGQRKIFEFF